MSIRSEAELEGMRAVGRVVALALAAMKSATRAGVTTGELAAIGGAVMRAHGARSAPALAIIAAGSGRAAVADDGWTVTTSDGASAAQYEHTLVITDAEPMLLTA